MTEERKGPTLGVRFRGVRLIESQRKRLKKGKEPTEGDRLRELEVVSHIES